MRLRYIGAYEGIEPRTGTLCQPGEVYEFEDSIATQLIASGQFEQVVESSVATGGEK